MADTGAPWNIPYVENADLVKDYPAASLALANAIDAGLDAAGGLVAVKSAIFTGTQTNSTAAGANFAVTDLTITHETAAVANKLIISAFLGSAGSSQQQGNVGLAIHDGTGLIAIGASPGSRTAITSGGSSSGSQGNWVVVMPSVTFVHTPGAGSKTYTVRAVNVDSGTETVYINRTETDSNNAFFQRAVSSLVIMEVRV